MDVQAPAFEPVINLSRNRETNWLLRTFSYRKLIYFFSLQCRTQRKKPAQATVKGKIKDGKRQSWRLLELNFPPEFFPLTGFK
jgi:hypothetical protein